MAMLDEDPIIRIGEIEEVHRARLLGSGTTPTKRLRIDCATATGQLALYITEDAARALTATLSQYLQVRDSR